MNLKLIINFLFQIIKNIFLLDYYYSYKGSIDLQVNWNTFIGNFYDKHTGYKFTKEVIMERFKGIAEIGLPKINGKTPEKSEGDEEYDKLYQQALRATQYTEKAKYREDAKNEKIAATDTKLYLAIRELNKSLQANDNNDSVLLGRSYYLLTGFTRIHFCAKEVGIETGFLCKPQTLIGYMREIGLYDSFSYKSLFENPFFLCLTDVAKDDIDRIIKVGINFKGIRGLVRLKYDVKKEVDTILSSVNDSDKISAYHEISEKGYNFVPDVQALVDKINENLAQHFRDEREKDQLKEEIEQLKKKVIKLEQREKNDDRQYIKSKVIKPKNKNKKNKNNKK